MTSTNQSDQLFHAVATGELTQHQRWRLALLVAALAGSEPPAMRDQARMWLVARSYFTKFADATSGPDAEHDAEEA